ncbi:hypothetical protein BJP34_16030 [Moorena producens PAL-8-15-08-1]|uniref:SCP2 domain-containing protein n=1 Tax=Moorena producens PAL-8-15-08-1 TaxID=1458985 RepID=A0A1D8TSY6_9CYAN|nr:hypothetical protein [Moorena producens]AOX00750.1 hypothetical protein BJP34_16030 [Moorena producens PAL-8-15-08-1]
MTNTTTERQEQLATWLRRLIEVLRLQGGETWKILMHFVSEKTVAIAFDGIMLQVTAEGGDYLQLKFDYIVSPDSIDFCSDAHTFRDIVAGRLTVDGALANGRIYARNNLDELLGIYEVVMRILADSAANPQLQELWMEFDQSWSGSPIGNPPSALETQKPTYNYLINSVPEDVLEIDVKPYL